MSPTIFVSIASYRDPDCQNTVHDLFEKAAHPERLIIGLCLQIVPDEDEDCRVLSTFAKQLRLIEIHAADSRGACWARHQIHTLYRGEDYYFQVDSHMRFVRGWDEKLIAMLDKCPSDKAVISTYPLEFTPPGQLAPDSYITIRPLGFSDDGVLTQHSWFYPMESAPKLPAPSAFVSAGMLFASGKMVKEVPYDPHLYFTGEEITLGARLWTNGWEIYCPNEVIAYHNYSQQTPRPRHWTDQTNRVTELINRSHRRLRHILGIRMREGDSEDFAEIERYGLGSKRTLAEYEIFSGLSFKEQLFEGKPLPLPESTVNKSNQVKSRSENFTQEMKSMKKHFIGVAGLPRSGSTLLCQLLAEHPEIHCEGHSSPLCNSLLATRRFISDDQFLLSQLDVQADATYAHLKSAMQGFLHGWHGDCNTPVVVDKNRAWMHCIEFLLHLDPDAKLLVPIRELGQIYGSIEAQHQNTILLDFIDHLADFDRFGRADQLFAKDKAIGAPLSSIQAVQDLPQSVKDRLYFVKFEDLMAQPVETMTNVYAWMGVAPHKTDANNIAVHPHESDSHYRNKYLHRQHTQIVAPKPHEIPPRIQEHIERACGWYYEWFYPKKK